MIDSHVHLGDGSFDDDRDQVVCRAKESGLSDIINICTDEETLNKGLMLAEKWPFVHNTAATTPHDVEGDTFSPLVEKHINQLVAVGETGLDYYYEHAPRGMQQDFLRRYLRLAKSHDLPVVIHCRDAFDDFFRIYDEINVFAVLHCFTGTLEEALQCVERKMMVSFSGIVTFKKSEALREVVQEVPLDQLLIETDSPYLAPQTQRGKRNEPAFVAEVANTIADVKGLDLQEVITVTAANARCFFRLTESK